MSLYQWKTRQLSHSPSGGAVAFQDKNMNLKLAFLNIMSWKSESDQSLLTCVWSLEYLLCH